MQYCYRIVPVSRSTPAKELHHKLEKARGEFPIGETRYVRASRFYKAGQTEGEYPLNSLLNEVVLVVVKEVTSELVPATPPTERASH